MPNPCRSISAADKNIASGFAAPVPAMSGADPCTGSNSPGPSPPAAGPPPPSGAPGRIPRHPRARGADSRQRDRLALLARVAARVGGGVLGRGLLAEVDPSGELADHDEVGSLDQLALERTRVIQRRHGSDRAEFRDKSEP